MINREWSQKILMVLLPLLILGGAAGLWLGSHTLLERVSRGFLEAFAEEAPSFGFGINEADFFNVSFSNNGVTWSNLTAQCELPTAQNRSPYQDLSVLISELALQTNDLLKGEFFLTVNGINVMASSRKGGSKDSYDGYFLRIPFRVDWKRPADWSGDLKTAFQGFLELIRSGSTERKIEFTGAVALQLREGKFNPKIIAEYAEGKTFWVMDKEDIRKFSDDLRDQLTDEEVSLFSKFPIRVPRLIALRESAEDDALNAHRENPEVPEDACRHILWSYRLTREFGERFAREVTDAHETDPRANTKQEHEMDYHNNAIGRTYALAGYPESTLLDRVLVDPEIIREVPKPLKKNTGKKLTPADLLKEQTENTVKEEEASL